MAETVQHNLTPVFRMHVIPNEQASKSAGRPIFDQMEVVEIRFPGDRQKVAVFPAHDAEPNATRASAASGGDVVTYAMHYAPQYRQFKAAESQSVSGTPIEELPFLQANKRSELKALNIHTAEALAGLDGQPLKQLGMGGRELKMQAQAYIDNARGSADVTSLAAEVAQLRQQIADRDNLIKNFATKPAVTRYQKGVERSVTQQQEAMEAEAEVEAEATVAHDADADHTEEAAGEGKALEDCTDAELKAYIKRETGSPVRGNPSRDTLLNAALEVAKSQTEGA